MENTSPELLDALLAAETAVWEALVAGDAAADAAALSDDFLGLFPSGFSDKAGHVSQLADGPTVAGYRLSEARAVAYGNDHALLAYRADYTRPGAPEESAMYVASLWRRQGEGWINVFSMDTPAAEGWDGP